MNKPEPVIYGLKEYLDVVDEQDQHTGVKKLRAEIHRDGDWHREVHVWLYNGKGELLFQLRGSNQETFPNCWDVSAGGHVSAGSDYEMSAVKELGEELGIKITSAQLQEIDYRHGTVKDKMRKLTNTSHRKVYAVRYDGSLSSLHPEEGTIADLKFFSEEEVRALPENYDKEPSLIPESRPYLLFVFQAVRELLRK